MAAPSRAGKISGGAEQESVEWLADKGDLVTAAAQASSAVAGGRIEVAPEVEAEPLKALIAAAVLRRLPASAAVPAGAAAEAAVDPVVGEGVGDEGSNDVFVIVIRARNYQRTRGTSYEHVKIMMEEEMMLAKFKRKEKLARTGMLAVIVAGTMLFLGESSSAATVQQKSFPSPEEAVKAAVTAAKNNDDKELVAIFGPGSQELIRSGDPVADKQRRAQFIKAYDEKNRLVAEGENRIVVIGKDDWPFPIPMIKKGEGWVFDTDKGKEEILNRRIGQNELDAIQVSLAYVDAQREYAMKARSGGGLLEYAQKFRSDQGKKNGLYWEAKAGEEPSPLGPFAARARSEGYGQKNPTDKPVPYHGYYYKILTAQGKDAPGGAYSYIVKGKMIGGFGLVAYPAQYGNSGVMTFIVNHEGKVFQKNLGKNTAAIATAAKEYNPDKTWTEVKE